jgi:uncharacterized membrane protein YesL
MTSEHWSVRAHSAFSLIAWCVALNALWIIFTLLGGIVFGLAPATVAACVLVRRRMRGESIHFRDFAMTWRRELLRGNAVLLPVLVPTVLLASNYMFFAALGPEATAARLVTLAALVLAIGVGAHVGPMYAHYDVPLRSYVAKATRFALGRPASTVVLLCTFAAFAFASAKLPVLLVTVSIGGWLQTSTWLCVRAFEENEDRLAAARAAHCGADVNRPGIQSSLPREPLRIH